MTVLTELTPQQVSDYVAGLDLSPGTEAYTTLGVMLLLPAPTFARAVSALAGGLLTFADVRSLPAVNASLVESLIAGRLSDTDPGSLAYSYSRVWVPATIDAPRLGTEAMGSVPVYLAARLYDYWGSLVRPRYDFTGSDPTAFRSYAQALAAYLALVNGGEGAAAVAAFRAAHAALRAAYPDLLQPRDVDCPVLQAVESLLTSAYFLERPGGGRAPNEILDFVAGATFRFVSPPTFKRFMESIAYPGMAAAAAAGGDPQRTGRDGAAAVAADPSNAWYPLPGAGIEWAFSRARMARVWLPGAYGHLVLGPAELQDGYARQEALVAYLDSAKRAVDGVRDAAHLTNLAPPAGFQSGAAAGAGQSVGLLLAITQP